MGNLSVKDDSGAINSVGPLDMARGVRIRETPASRSGMKYRAANGTPSVNQGEKSVNGITTEVKRVNLTCQIADVMKPLGSVRAMLEAGNQVVFEKGK